MKIKDEIFCFAHLRWRWTSNILIVIDTSSTPASNTQNIGCPSIMTPSEMGKTKNLIFYSQATLKIISYHVFTVYH